MVLNNKGIFFTIFVILIITLFALTFTFFASVEKRETTYERITTLNNFVFSIEEDIPRKINIATFRIIFLLEKRIVETGGYISNLDSIFAEAFYNGTIQGISNPEIDSLMSGATFPDILTEFQEKAQKIGAVVYLNNPALEIKQEDPWNVKSTLSINLEIIDVNNLAVWNKTSSYSSLIPIQNFEDPIYVVETNGLVTNKITKTPYENFIEGADVSNLSDHLINSYYISSIDAPSFLDRMQGNLISNNYGIESLVNLQKLSSQGVSTEDKTAVDHIYFSSSNPSVCNVLPSGLPSWFKLDDSHLSDYEVSCA